MHLYDQCKTGILGRSSTNVNYSLSADSNMASWTGRATTVASDCPAVLVAGLAPRHDNQTS